MMRDLDANRKAISGKPAGSVDLKDFTDARVLLGRFGAGQPTTAAQSFLLDHARARQAVWSQVDWSELAVNLSDLGLPILRVDSLASDRSTYIKRPDLGRRLSEASATRLASVDAGQDIVIIVADGLSANAVSLNAAPLIRALVQRFRSEKMSVGLLVLAAQARVALGDPIGELLKAKVSVLLVGERPGLSASDSLGAYVTYAPQTGTPDSRRNCVSNIRDGGLQIDTAAEEIVALTADMRRTGISGVGLKDALGALARSAEVAR